MRETDGGGGGDALSCEVEGATGAADGCRKGWRVTTTARGGGRLLGGDVVLLGRCWRNANGGVILSGPNWTVLLTGEWGSGPPHELLLRDFTPFPQQRPRSPRATGNQKHQTKHGQEPKTTAHGGHGV